MMPAADRKALYRYGYRRSPDQDASAIPHHHVVVVGAGPVGLSAALDLAWRGVPVVVLDDRSEEHTSELQSRSDLVCRLLLEKKKKKKKIYQLQKQKKKQTKKTT